MASDRPSIDHLKCRLYLYGVFPAMPELVANTPEARDIIAQEPFSIGFKTFSKLRTALALTPEGGEVWHDEDRPADIDLYFHTDGQAVAAFERRGGIPPMPVRGFTRIGLTKRFEALGDLLMACLRPSNDRLADPNFRDFFATISFGVAMRSVAQLCDFETASKALLANGPRGIVSFQLGSGGKPIWVRLEPGHLGWGTGKPPREADALMTFHDSHTAAAALLDRLDAIAAVNAGRVELEGLVPLADLLNRLLERVSRYLP